MNWILLCNRRVSRFFNLIFVKIFPSTWKISNLIFIQFKIMFLLLSFSERKILSNRRVWFFFRFNFEVGWHHYNLSDQLYNSSSPATSLYYDHQQPDSTSSSLLQQPVADVSYFNNSTDSSDYVTTTSLTSPSSACIPPTSAGNVSFQQRRGSLQLWQFLIALLDEPSSK